MVTDGCLVTKFKVKNSNSSNGKATGVERSARILSCDPQQYFVSLDLKCLEMKIRTQSRPLAVHEKY